MTNSHLFLGHGLNLKPEQMSPLAHQLKCEHTLLKLDDHSATPELLWQRQNFWQAWSKQADQWVQAMDENSLVLAYSLSAPLITQALVRANKRVDRLALIAPAFFLRHAWLRKASSILPSTFPVPSFSPKAWRIQATLPLQIYRELESNSAPYFQPKNIAKHIWLGMHPHDEMINGDETELWAKSHGLIFHALDSRRHRPFHAAFRPSMLPLGELQTFFFSNT